MKILPFFALISLLNFSCQKKSSSKFVLLGYFYKGEEVNINFNQNLIYRNKFDKKNRYIREEIDVYYTPKFSVNLKIVYHNKVLKDTTLIGFYKNNNQGIFIPIAMPNNKYGTPINKKLINKWLKLSPDSLRRNIILREL
ncbi:hypothetical protein DNI29_22190 [Hymenobacter sediminis]|uniref:hypothetical protein n=1 Tax=Hymenobacter sediminis TaxID=2218621 RepID=UPI000F51567E|nr:hypothetical protein [Hymenobacter sediminis]RPD44110.1 hypothetical protein DNI29_22190 [Hymenobacter sediminis]